MAVAGAKSGQAAQWGKRMGDVILFSPRRQSSAGRRRIGESDSAEIMFFTGVRYQRMSDSACAEATGGRPKDGNLGGKRKRKRG
jgi:hypothetical protein